MINNHADILALYPSTKDLLNRISEVYEGKITPEQLTALGHVLRSARNRGSIGIDLWQYLINVSHADYRVGKILITARMLHEARPK